METLLFRTRKDYQSQFGNLLKTTFVKEGDISDALTYFDGSDLGHFFHNDEEGAYYSTDDGDPLITDEIIEDNETHSFRVDMYRVWTKKINDLDKDELLSLVEDAYPSLIRDGFLANGFTEEEFEVAKYFEDFGRLIEVTENGRNYIEWDFFMSDSEPESGRYFEYKGKFYTKH